jgi:hypothetical protein
MHNYILKVFKTTAEYEEGHLTDMLQRLISPISPAYHPQFETPHELLEAYLEAEWTEVFDMAMMESGDVTCRSFRAPIPGFTHFLHLTQTPPDATLKLMARDPIDPSCDCELFAYGVSPKYQEMEYTTLMVGGSACESDGDVVWSITPGPLRPPRKWAPHALNETEVTRTEAMKLGMHWAYIVGGTK